jgi:hypothetical protein
VDDGSSDSRSERLAALIGQLGGHASAELGLDLDEAADVGRWFVAACLLSGRGDEPAALDAWRALAEAGLERPETLAATTPERVEGVLAAGGTTRPAPLAGLLVRASLSLAEQGGSPAALSARAESFEELAGEIARLAPGLGVASVLRFLQPLRDRWPAALETPLSRAARAAALHLGLIGEGEDEEGEPGSLRAALRELEGAPDLADVEAALDRLGRRACLRGRTERCPLGPACPARRETTP